MSLFILALLRAPFVQTTTATTTLALMPILTSTGRGSDVMVPMAIPSIGGMTVALITIFVVPTLYCLVEELKLRRAARETNVQQPAHEGR